MKNYPMIFFLLILCFLISCKSPAEPEKHASVIMFEGPIYVEDEYSFSYKGTVKNIGDLTAKFAKVYIYLRKSDNSLIDQEDTYIDDTELLPQETSSWDWMWLDFDGTLRDKMDKNKTTFEIKWDE